LGVNLEHFWLVVCPPPPKLLINATTIDVRILINAQTLAPPRGCKFAKFASQIGPYPFSSLWANTKAP